MKVIDLLNKIANSGAYEKETHFKYYDRNAEEYDISLLLYKVIIDRLEKGQIDLNDEVEIIEEDKKIETINSFTSNVGAVDENNIEEYIHKLFEQELILYFKINEIIDYINKGD